MFRTHLTPFLLTGYVVMYNACIRVGYTLMRSSLAAHGAGVGVPFHCRRTEAQNTALWPSQGEGGLTFYLWLKFKSSAQSHIVHLHTKFSQRQYIAIISVLRHHTPLSFYITWPSPMEHSFKINSVGSAHNRTKLGFCRCSSWNLAY